MAVQVIHGQTETLLRPSASTRTAGSITCSLPGRVAEVSGIRFVVNSLAFGHQGSCSYRITTGWLLT
jgi:hypothetical protein